jgi:CDP-paratose 2-epimerase
MSVDFEWKAAQARLGVLEWLRPGEYERAERTLEDLRALNIARLRSGISWSDWHSPAGREWFDWFIPRAAQQVDLLPCVSYTPPSLRIEANTSSPPTNPKDYANFVDLLITHYGDHFEWIELWNESNNLNDWDWRLDQDWVAFSQMIDKAAQQARNCGKKTVFAGVCSTDPNCLETVCAHGVLTHIDVVGLQGFPGTWEFESETWPAKIEKIREVLDHHDLHPDLWLTEVGYSTWQHDEIAQVKTLIDALEAPVDRVYWYSTHDLHPHESGQDGFFEDKRHYHFGMKTADGTPKLMYRVWRESGLGGLHKLAEGVFHGDAHHRGVTNAEIR